MGFPIRKSSDQSSFAAPQGLSQRTTSFIASQRQGIHRMPLNHFITLMIDVRRGRSPKRHHQKDHWTHLVSEIGRSGSADPDCTCRTQPADDAVKPRLVRSRRALRLIMTGRSCSLFTMYKIARRANAQHSQNSLMDIPGDNGGARRDRTDDLMLAKHALSQLSYGPSFVEPRSPTPCTSSSRRQSLRKPKRRRR